ncbi:unnamed protein product, partial [Hapterophycus canaliculatus]
WWREARFTGRLGDCNNALATMMYWPDVNWNGVDRVHVSAVETIPEGTESGSSRNDGGDDGNARDDAMDSRDPTEVSMFVRVGAVNDAPVVTPPSPKWHSTVRTGDLLSPSARYGSRMFVREDSVLLLPGFTIRDVDLDEAGGEDSMITVT